MIRSIWLLGVLALCKNYVVAVSPDDSKQNEASWLRQRREKEEEAAPLPPSGGADEDKNENWLIEEIVSIHEVARKMLLQHQTSLLTSSVRFECTTLKLIGEWCKFLHRVSSSIDVFVDQKQG